MKPPKKKMPMPVEPDADDAKRAPKKKPPVKAQPQWAGIANQMMAMSPKKPMGKP